MSDTSETSETSENSATPDAAESTETAESSETAATDASQEPEREPDPVRDALVAELQQALGDGFVESHIIAGKDLWVRVDASAWLGTAAELKASGFTFFSFLSAIDWMPSPYGKGEEDPTAESAPRATAITQGYAGGETRFQVFARLVDLSRRLGVTLKADVPEDTMAVDSWSRLYAGANWHEREAHEMFGISFTGHPDLRNLYLPGEFEGHPLRKDFPLLARMIKPWPGIVDVEPLPPEDPDEPTDAADASADEPAAESQEGEASAGEHVNGSDAPGEGSASDEPDAARGGSEADDEPATSTAGEDVNGADAPGEGSASDEPESSEAQPNETSNTARDEAESSEAQPNETSNTARDAPPADDSAEPDPTDDEPATSTDGAS